MMCNPCKDTAEAIRAGYDPRQLGYGHKICPSLVTIEGCKPGTFKQRETPDHSQCTCQHRIEAMGRFVK